MISTEDYEKIIEYTRNVWTELLDFKKKRVAPQTLIYDPLSTFDEFISGLAHVAHDYLEFGDPDPDSRILIYDKQANQRFREQYPNQEHEPIHEVFDLKKIPLLDCIFICSSENADEVNFVLSKLNTGGLVIVFNEAFKMPSNYKRHTYKENLTLGHTQTYRHSDYDESKVSVLLESIETYVK